MKSFRAAVEDYKESIIKKEEEEAKERAQKANMACCKFTAFGLLKDAGRLEAIADAAGKFEDAYWTLCAKGRMLYLKFRAPEKGMWSEEFKALFSDGTDTKLPVIIGYDVPASAELIYSIEDDRPQSSADV